MMVRGALLLLPLLPLVAAACATGPAPSPGATVHPRFSGLRPVFVSVRVEAPPAVSGALDDALRRELIEKSYSPLAPGATPDAETGVLLVVATRERAEAAFSGPDGKLLYSMSADADLEQPATLAKELLGSLPPK